MEKTRKFVVGAVIGFMLLVTLVAGVFAANAMQNTLTSHGGSNAYDQAGTAVSLQDNPNDNDAETADDGAAIDSPESAADVQDNPTAADEDNGADGETNDD